MHFAICRAQTGQEVLISPTQEMRDNAFCALQSANPTKLAPGRQFQRWAYFCSRVSSYSQGVDKHIPNSDHPAIFGYHYEFKDNNRQWGSQVVGHTVANRGFAGPAGTPLFSLNKKIPISPIAS